MKTLILTLFAMAGGIIRPMTGQNKNKLGLDAGQRAKLAMFPDTKDGRKAKKEYLRQCRIG